MILCCGEALIDMVPEGGLFRPLPGGSVYNTAVALGRLGAATGFLWPISRDGFGEMLLAPLAEAGVATDLSPRVERPTTLAFVTLTEGEARYAFYDEGTAGRMFSAADLPALPRDVATVMVGGISLVNDPCGAAVEALVMRESGRLPIYLDANIRPFFITDPQAHRARLTRLMRKAAIVKLSADDLAWLWPGRPQDECAEEVLGMGPWLVLVTNGAAGARALHVSGSLMVPARKVAVADTIGAGDTFNAGVLAGLAEARALSHPRLAALNEATLWAAVAMGARAAEVCVSRPGADPPWARELA